MPQQTIATSIIDKNGKATTVHRGIIKVSIEKMRISKIPITRNVESDWEKTNRLFGVNTLSTLERNIDEWGMSGNDDPFDEENYKTGNYLETANTLTSKFGNPRLGGTRAVWDMGDYVAKLAFNDVGERANNRESEFSETQEIPVAHCYISDEFSAPVLIMEKVEEINWSYDVLGQEHLREDDYPWLELVEAQQAGITHDGRVVAFDLGEFWDGM